MSKITIVGLKFVTMKNEPNLDSLTVNLGSKKVHVTLVESKRLIKNSAMLSNC